MMHRNFLHALLVAGFASNVVTFGIATKDTILSDIRVPVEAETVMKAAAAAAAPAAAAGSDCRLACEKTYNDNDKNENFNYELDDCIAECFDGTLQLQLEGGGSPFGCHPGNSTVEAEDGTRQPLHQLSVGTRIRTPNGFHPVLGFLHSEKEVQGKYYYLATAKGEIAISSFHHLVINGEDADPSTAKVGDLLKSPDGDAVIERISVRAAEGAFHLFVEGGAYYVDGLLATDYNSHVPRGLWELSRAYVRARYLSGIPIIPEGHGKVFRAPFWAFDALDKWGVSTQVQWFFSPALVSTVVVSELLNTAAEYTWAPPLAGFCAAALVGLATAAVAKL